MEQGNLIFAAGSVLGLYWHLGEGWRESGCCKLLESQLQTTLGVTKISLPPSSLLVCWVC